jgi:hypothetical protein
MGTMDMMIAAQVVITSAPPLHGPRPERSHVREQKRLMVMAEVSDGKPARSAAMRATFILFALRASRSRE